VSLDEIEYADLVGARDKNDSCIPIFHTESILDIEASEDSGAKIYKSVPFVEIIVPGNDKERVDRPVEEKDKHRWPMEWRRFIDAGSNATQVEIDGTPLEEWAQITKAQAMTLKASNITTVEQLASIADINLQSLGMGMVELRNKADVYVKSQKGEISIQKAAAKTRAANKRIKTLEKQLKEMQIRLEEMEKRNDQNAPPNR